MIDVNKEQLIPLTVAAREQVNARGERGVAVSTLFRWWTRGNKGIRLETVLRGGSRMTSREALQRFFTATTLENSGQETSPPASPPVKSHTRERLKRNTVAAR